MSQPSTPTSSRRPSGLDASVTHFHLADSKHALDRSGATFTTTSSPALPPRDVAPTPRQHPVRLTASPETHRPDSLLPGDAGLFSPALGVRHTASMARPASTGRPTSNLRHPSSPAASIRSVHPSADRHRLRANLTTHKNERNPLASTSPQHPSAAGTGEGTRLAQMRRQTPPKPGAARIPAFPLATTRPVPVHTPQQPSASSTTTSSPSLTTRDTTPLHNREPDTGEGTGLRQMLAQTPARPGVVPASSFTTTRPAALNTPPQPDASSSTRTTITPLAAPPELVRDDGGQSPPPPPAIPDESPQVARQEPVSGPALTTPPNQEPATPPLRGVAAAKAAWLGVCARHEGNPEGRLLRDETQGVHPRTLDEVHRLNRLFTVAQTGAREDPALSGRLDALYTIYASNTPPGIQTHHVARTSATLEALLELGTTPQTLRLAIFMSRVRDFFSQMSASMAGYLGSWFAGACTTIAMLREGVPETVTTPTSAMVIGVGSRTTARFIRHAGMAPGWTRVVATDDTRQTVPAIRTYSGFARSTLAYWPFMASLSYVTWGTPDPAHADGKAQRAQWALDRQEARRYYNVFATLGVGAHRYFTAPEREITWLNALDGPGDPPEYRKHVMKGAIEELTNLEKTAKSAAWYVLARPFIGVWGALYLGDAWRSIQSTMAQYNPAASAGGQVFGKPSDTKSHHPALEPVPMTEAQAIRARSGNLMMLAALVAVVAVINLARRTTADYPRGSHFIDSGLDILLLAAWGGIVSSVEVESLENPSITDESRRLTAQWHLELAQAGGFGPVAEVPGAVNPNQVAPPRDLTDDPEAPDPDEV